MKSWVSALLVVALAPTTWLACSRSPDVAELFADIRNADYATVLSAVPECALPSGTTSDDSTQQCSLQRARLLALAGTGDAEQLLSELPPSLGQCPELGSFDMISRMVTLLLTGGARLDDIQRVIAENVTASPERASALQEFAADYVARHEGWFPCPLGHGRDCRPFAAIEYHPDGCRFLWSHDLPGWKAEHEGTHEDR